MKPTAPPVKRGRPGNDTGRYFFITRSTTSRPSCTSSLPDWHRGRCSADLRTTVKLSITLPFSSDFDAVAGLADDRARIAADERVAAEMFAAFDRFEQERFALAADFAISRERRFDIGEQPARDRNQIALRRRASEIPRGWERYMLMSALGSKVYRIVC